RWADVVARQHPPLPRVLAVTPLAWTADLAPPLLGVLVFAIGLVAAAVPWVLAGVVERALERQGRHAQSIAAGLAIRRLALVLVGAAATVAADRAGFRPLGPVAWTSVAAAVLFVALGVLVVWQVAGAVERSLRTAGQRHVALIL